MPAACKYLQAAHFYYLYDMKILTAEQIRQADLLTMENEPVEPVDLMERAAEAMAQWICNNVPQDKQLLFCIGKGNNGGDGLAMARILYHAGFDCCVVLPYETSELSADCAFNLSRLPEGVGVQADLPAEIDADTVIIDALIGTGFKGGELQPALESLIGRINALPCNVISVDMPSGMVSGFGNAGRSTVHAWTTLTLETPKLAQLLPEAGKRCGRLEVMPIGLDADFIASAPTPYYYVTQEIAASMCLPRAKFSHKGTYGHTLLICGSEGMAGAAVLATGGALRSGCGLVTTHIPREERMAVQTNFPSAMLSLDPGACLSELPPDLERFNSVCIGPGIGRGSVSSEAFELLLQRYRRPVVVDADAINMLASNRTLCALLPAGSILTPHPGELGRLTGQWRDDEHKMRLAGDFASQYNVYVVVKGAYTMTATPDGRFFFNSSGCAGMARGGSGDVLAGFLAGLLARGYDPLSAALTGVFIHGLAGEKTAEYYGAEAMMSSEIIDFLAEALHEIE